MGASNSKALAYPYIVITFCFPISSENWLIDSSYSSSTEVLSYPVFFMELAFNFNPAVFIFLSMDPASLFFLFSHVILSNFKPKELSGELFTQMSYGRFDFSFVHKILKC